MNNRYKIPTLPLKQDVETKTVLKRLAPAHRRLAELKGVARQTASKYLAQLVDKNYLKLLKIGKSNFYLNEPLFDLFINAHHTEAASDAPLIESM